MIRTRAKMQVVCSFFPAQEIVEENSKLSMDDPKYVASGRARRPNVPGHIRCPSPSYNQEQYNSISK